MRIQDLYQLFRQHPSVSTDTRNIRTGSLFFALKGVNFNGNVFAAQSLELGAEYAIIDEVAFDKGQRYILVDDVLATLQELARYHRQQLEIPVVGVTGTNGKTTTKELLHAVLSQKFKTFATHGNLNNHIGVPLSLLTVDDSYEIAIIEMGANHVGEIASLCNIAQPTHGLITNVGKAHLEGFGSFEGVKKAKGELYDYLQKHRGTLFLQGNNRHLMEMAGTRKISWIITYGLSALNDVFAKLVAADPYLSIAWGTRTKRDNRDVKFEVRTNLTGSYNLENFLAAIAVGLHFGVEAV
ncbi:MAG TPA: UDP-N-acetylmuramoyl-tripeptide--D-alanyl-D-alanine ligase, partial [Sphingobacterium sp.]|nr:UDP-N-acetylmuramoyl-tripeptide--D-alanyl-D-alanine ligase [Sphingobacterium sp.]